MKLEVVIYIFPINHRTIINIGFGAMAGRRICTDRFIRYSAAYSANEQNQAIEYILNYINFTQQRFGQTEHGIPPHRQALPLSSKYIMTAREFQNDLLPLIQTKFPDQQVRNEWAAFTGQRHQYSPRVDIAVGPFNVGQGPNLTDTYNQLIAVDTTVQFLTQAFEFHQHNLDVNLYQEIVHPNFNHLINKNQNARCFIGFEIENKNSKKHIMGSVVNAASLGRVGIGIAFSDSTLRTFCRILNYLSFLRRVEKNTYDTTNFMILSIEQINQLLE